MYNHNESNESVIKNELETDLQDRNTEYSMGSMSRSLTSNPRYLTFGPSPAFNQYPYSNANDRLQNDYNQYYQNGSGQTQSMGYDTTSYYQNFQPENNMISQFNPWCDSNTFPMNYNYPVPQIPPAMSSYMPKESMQTDFYNTMTSTR